MKRHLHGADAHAKLSSGSKTVYERQMVGEMGAHPHHFNYEAEMVGEKPVSRPPRHSNIKGGKKCDENHHQMFAMGGVGKMRHGQSDKSGHQKSGKHRHGH